MLGVSSGIAVGVVVVALIVWLLWRARQRPKDEGAKAPEIPIREISDEEFWGLYWQRRLGIRRENKMVRAKNMNVILFGQIPVSPIHSPWVYELEKSLLGSGLITQPAGKNWLPTDEGKRALEARLAKEEKPAKPFRPLVNAETLQNVDLDSTGR
jgi:hypothetical protein